MSRSSRHIMNGICAMALTVLVCAGCSGTNESHDAQEPAERPHAGEAHIELSAEQVKAAQIALEQAGPAMIRETLPVYGVIALNAEHVRDVGARFPGVVRTVVKRVGDDVRRGEVLATIESNESLQTYAVVAPLDGVVTARQANPGEQSGEKVLFTVADLDSVWAELALFPRDVGRIRIGQAARVSSSAGGLSGEGKIVYVASVSNNASQTLIARVQLDNAQRRWTPGLYVSAEITLAESRVPVAVRSAALQTVADDTVVFVRNDKGFEPRAVRSARADREWIEIAAGLAAGETYAAANSFIVKAELGKGSAEHEH